MLYPLDTSSGLPSNQIHRLAIDASSRLWFATPAGLASFDGHFVDAWDRRRGLQCNGLRSVGTSPDGTVWIGTDLGLELLDERGHAALRGLSTLWSFGLCEHVDAGGEDVWIGAARGLVRVKRRAGEASFDVLYSAPIGFVSDVRRNGRDRVVAASSLHGLVESDGQQWWPHPCHDLVEGHVTRVMPTPTGLLFVGTDQGLYVLDESSRRLVCRLRPSECDPAVKALGMDDRFCWVAFGRTLMAYDRKTIAASPPPSESYLAASPINDVLSDAHGNVWIATNNTGLAQVSSLRHALSRIDLGSPGGVYVLRKQRDTDFLVGGEDLFGVARIDDRGATPLKKQQGLPSATVWDGLEDDSGTWVATQAGLFRATAGADFKQVHDHDAVLGAPNRVLMRRGDDLWVGTLSGLARIRSGRVIPERDDEGRPLGYVYALQEDSKGVLWIATLGRGLWRHDGRLRPFCESPLSETGNTYAIAPGPEGNWVVLQDEKVVIIDQDLHARLLCELPPISGWTAQWVDRRTIAIGTSDGLKILDPETREVACHVQALYPLRDWEFTNNRSLALDSSGRFLCGVNGGLLRVDLKLLAPHRTPPVCQIKDVEWIGAEPTREESAHVVPPGRWAVRVRAFSAWWVDHKNVRYQFQLVGFDEDWSSLKDRPEVTYTSLPQGDYRLMARAYSPLSGFGPAAELMRIVVKRPWWTMGWAAALAAADGAYDRVVRSRARNATLLEQNQSLETAVQRRTLALTIANEELSTLRDAYKQMAEVDPLTQLGNRRRFAGEFVRARALGRRLQSPFALLFLDLDEFKAINDLYGHSVGDQYLTRVGRVLTQTIRTGEDVAARLGGEEFALLLSNTGREGALTLGERVRAAVEATGLPNSASRHRFLTVSVGVAVVTPDERASMEDLMTRADEAVYRAKHLGRNRVEIADW